MNLRIFSKWKAGFMLVFLSLHALSQNPVPAIWLSLTNPLDSFDRAVVAFSDNATDSFDVNFDSPKVIDSTAAILLYSKIGTKPYSIQALPPLNDDKTVTLSMNAAVSGMHRLRLTEIENLDESASVVLEDVYLGTFSSLSKERDYWFNLASGNDIERFKLHIHPAVGITTVNGTCDGTQSLLQLSQPGSQSWNYEVRNENNNIIDSGNSWNGVLSLVELPTGNYSISLVDRFGYTVVKHAAVEDKESVVAQFQVSDSVVSVNKPVFFFDYSIGASDYVWDFGDGNVLTGIPFPQNVFSAPGIYHVHFTAANNECADATYKTIEVIDNFTGITGKQDKSPVIYAAGKDVFIEFSPQITTIANIEVFDASGRKIYNQYVPSFGKHIISLPDAKSWCIVRITCGTSRFQKSVMLR